MNNNYYEERQPFFTEALFFKNNPHVGGYASFDDNKIVHNPFNGFTDEQRNGIKINEGTRLFLNNHPLFAPKYELTPYQKFKLGNYSPNGQDVRNTIAGRYFSNDTSIGPVSDDQRDRLEVLRRIGDLYNWR